MKRRLSGINLSSEKNLPTFQLNAPVVIRLKVKRCEQMLLFIAMHYWGCMPLEVKGWWGLLLPSCLLIAAVQQLGSSSPPCQNPHPLVLQSYWCYAVHYSHWPICNVTLSQGFNSSASPRIWTSDTRPLLLAWAGRGLGTRLGHERQFWLARQSALSKTTLVHVAWFLPLECHYSIHDSWWWRLAMSDFFWTTTSYCHIVELYKNWNVTLP